MVAYNICRKNIWLVLEFQQEKIDSFLVPTALLKFSESFSGKIISRKKIASPKSNRKGAFSKKSISLKFDRRFHT